MANWQGHETHPTGHKTSEVDWGGHDPNGSDNPPPMSIINLDDLLGRTFLIPMDENGERKRATISEHVKDQLRFKLKIDGDQLDDLISYNQLMEYLEDKTDTGPLEDGFYRFKCIKDHKGPYTSSDPEYNGSSYNLLIEWEPGEQTWEPLSNIIASDPYTCAVYAKEHNLLNTPGWKLLKRHARTARRLIRTLKKSKHRQARASRKNKHGWEVPRDYAHALQLDIHNDNNKWKEAIDLEIIKSKNIKYSQMLEMHTSKHSQGRNFTLWVGLNLENYKDMFLSCTKHFMVQDQEEHVGIINSLTYSITWVSRPQKLIGVVMTITLTM